MATSTSSSGRRPRLRFTLAAASVIAMLALAACGGGSDPTPTAVPPLPTEAPTEVPTDAPAEVATEAPTEAPADAITEEAPPEVATEVAGEEEEAVGASEAVTDTEELPGETEEEIAEEPTAEATEEPAEEVAASEEVTGTEELPGETEEEISEEPTVEPTAEPAEEVATTESSATTEPTIDSARQVAEIINNNDAVFVTVSPNGAQLAYYLQHGRRNNFVQQICLFTFANADENCYDFPTGEFAGYPYMLQWSPDSTLITFTENPLELGNDADIWILDVNDGTYTDLTNDGIMGSWQSALSNGEEPLIDYMPSWSPDGEIVFWRVIPQGNLEFEVGIFQVSPDGGDAEEIRNVSSETPNFLINFQNATIFMDGYSAVSPDGKTLAAILNSVSSMGSMVPVVYLFDLEDPSVEAISLISGDDWASAIPSWQTFPAAPLGLSWSGDGAGVVVFAFSNATQTPFSVLYYADVATGVVTPVVDFAEVETPSDYMTTNMDTGLPMRAYSPWSASLAPDGQSVLMVNDLGGTTGVFWAPLPPTGELPPVIGSQDSFSMSQVTRSSRASNGMVLVYGILLTVSE